jgi:hypothetical protein
MWWIWDECPKATRALTSRRYFTGNQPRRRELERWSPARQGWPPG